ncbi:hypothetical protein FBZ83_11975 [Azospirillum brasilense]|uniref:Uncharacterized protein n=1 Tax=Azospirillum brasilense TaxID=192 RepID=A0A560BUX8_AZOBR|nr:hypothetical protein [Azospirillum brasilense]TWA76424.1 hypothetical protein FBZ83_11975 [Azospirillum brasilense]
MNITPYVWAQRFDPANAALLLKEGGEFRVAFRKQPWLGRAMLVSNLLSDGIEDAVGKSGLTALLKGASSGGHMIRGGTFATDVAGAVRSARTVLTVTLLSLDGTDRSKEVLRARDICSATVLLLAAEPGLQAMAREWFGSTKGGVRQLGRMNLPGIGAALLSAHMSGPQFDGDALPGIAGSLLTEVS